MALGSITDTNPDDSLSTAQKFVNSVRSSIFNIMTAVNVGKYDGSYTQSGAQFSLGRSPSAGSYVSTIPTDQDPYPQLFPRNYDIASMTPNASVIVKKRIFSTTAADNDPKMLDSNERSFLRASKSLFSLKAFQIATYEALTKFEQVLQQDKTLYVPAIIAAVQNANAFGALSDDESSGMMSELFSIAQRDLAGVDTNFTTWYIDQTDIDLANIGRGVGVIEFTNFTKVDTSNSLHGDGTASIDFEDPYHIMLISNDDIEYAIRDALYDPTTTGLLGSLNTTAYQNLSNNLNTQNTNDPNVANMLSSAGSSAFGSIQNSTNNIVSQQPLSPAAISFVRKRLRKFYLGKSIIQPTDGLNIFLASNSVFENNDVPLGVSSGLDRYGVDDTILRQEMYVVTKDRNFDFNLYKTLRDPNAFSGASVFAGVVEKVVDHCNDGFYTLSITAKNNLWFLEQSFVNTEPAIDQTQGFLHDPLTPFDFQFDNAGNIKTTSSNGAGFQLSQDNIDMLNQLTVKHETGTQRGNQVDPNSIITGTSPGTDVMDASHYPGMLYHWKEGIASVSIATNTSDPTGLFYNQSREAANSTYGLAITSTPFDNMDAANVISILVTGQPYNITTFLNDSVITGVLNSLATKNSSDSTSYFSALFDAIRRQNKVLGNFKPLVSGDVNIDTIKKLAYKKVSYRAIDTRIGQLEDQILTLQQQLNTLPQTIDAADTELLQQTRVGLQAEIQLLQDQENALIQQYSQLDSNMNTTSNTQASLQLSDDPDERQAQLEDLQYRAMYLSNKRIEDVRYNRDNNYFIVGTEYDADTDIQAFQANLRGAFNYFKNTYEPVINKIREAAGTIDFELFCDNSGNIRFRPPQYNKVPLSVYIDMFNRKGQQGVDIIPDFVQNMFVDTITDATNAVIQANWNMLIALGKSGDNSLINALNAYVPTSTNSSGNQSSSNQGIVEFLGFSGNQTSIGNGNTTDQLIEFNSSTQVSIDRAAPPSSVASTGNAITLQVMNTLATQMEQKFGVHLTISQDDIIATTDSMAITKRKELFKQLKQYSSDRNSAIKSYQSQLNNLGISANNIGNTQQQITAAVNAAVQAKEQQFTQQVFQAASAGSVQGYPTLTISPEFENLIQDDSRNYIGRGSGRRFIIRDDSIKSYQIEEAQPDFCRVNVIGQPNFGGQVSGPSVLEGMALQAGAVDYDLWRMYGFKTTEDKKVPFLTDVETQLKPYAVFMLLRQRKKVMRGSISIIGNEYYQLGDVVYLPDRDLLFYVTAVSHSFVQGEDFSTTLTLEYGRPPGEYIPTPLDVIGKTLLKQNTSSIGVVRRHMNPDTFYYPLRPTPVLYLANITTSDDTALQTMLGTDGNQGRLINALYNANIALQKANTVLVISGFTTGSDNDDSVQARLDTVSSWFQAPKTNAQNLSSGSLSDFTTYKAIPKAKILTKIVDLTYQAPANNATTGSTTNTPNPNDVIATGDQTIIQAISDPSLELGILNACQEAQLFINDFSDRTNQMPFIVEIGIFYKQPT